MGANLPFLSAGVFGPDDLKAMSLAYEEVCHALHINGDAGARRTIAVRVIELARRGEPCPTVLRDRVLAEAKAGTLSPASWFRDGISPGRIRGGARNQYLTVVAMQAAARKLAASLS